MLGKSILMLVLCSVPISVNAQVSGPSVANSLRATREAWFVSFQHREHLEQA